jgi:hypothetical protein
VGAVFWAFDVLRRFGGPDVVASVARFNANNGRFETAAQTSAGSSGKNFIVRTGDGLLISMHQSVAAFSVPGVGFGMFGEHFAVYRSVLSGGGGTVSVEGGPAIHFVIAQPRPLGISASVHYRLWGGLLGHSAMAEQFIALGPRPGPVAMNYQLGPSNSQSESVLSCADSRRAAALTYVD